MDNLINANNHSVSWPGIAFVVGVFTIAVLIYLNRKQIKQSWMIYRTQYCLQHLGLEQLSNVKFPDGLDHYFTADRLILRHDGITLLIYKKYSGKIYCAANIDEWTQMIGQKSYLFKNPLFELEFKVKAIASQLPDIPVDGFLFFDHTAEFPKGHPTQVMNPSQIPAELQRNNRHQVIPRIMAAWKLLQQKAAQQKKPTQ